jgi:hypothetical protein
MYTFLMKVKRPIPIVQGDDRRILRLRSLQLRQPQQTIDLPDHVGRLRSRFDQLKRIKFLLISTELFLYEALLEPSLN